MAYSVRPEPPNIALELEVCCQIFDDKKVLLSPEIQKSGGKANVPICSDQAGDEAYADKRPFA
jgi:hypothetical protein